jgi:hypothetical protein
MEPAARQEVRRETGICLDEVNDQTHKSDHCKEPSAEDERTTDELTNLASRLLTLGRTLRIDGPWSHGDVVEDLRIAVLGESDQERHSSDYTEDDSCRNWT